MNLRIAPGLFNIIGIVLLIAFSLMPFLPPITNAEEGQNVKRQYKESYAAVTGNKAFSIELMVRDNKLVMGSNEIELVIYDSAGNDVEDAEITLIPRIQGTEPEDSAETVVNEKGGGFYSVENINIDKAGLWELKVNVKKYRAEGSAVFIFPEIKEAATEITEAVPETATSSEVKVEMPDTEPAPEVKAVIPETELAPEVTAAIPDVETAAGVEEAATEAGSASEVQGIAPETAPVSEAEEAPLTPESGPAPAVIGDAPQSDPVTAVDYGKYRSVLKPLPAIPPIPADNPMTIDKIKLGKMLFWDRRVSSTGATSCVFCHYPSYYGAEPMRKSVGINGDIHLRNAQTVLNASFLNAQFWAGESPTLEHQALSVVKSHVAMRSQPEEVAERLNRMSEYRKLSGTVFGGPLTGEYIGKALAAFMRTLNTPDYPLARWLQGDEAALAENQKRGMSLFVDTGCVGCHSGPAFSGPSLTIHAEDHPDSPSPGLHLHRVILPGAEDDHGLAKKTGKEEDKYFFKVPSLLNAAQTPPYTHAGIIDSLQEMVVFMGENMLYIEYTADEIDDIAAFLHSLTGEIPRDFMTVPLLPVGGGKGDYGPGLLPSGTASDVPEAGIDALDGND